MATVTYDNVTLTYPGADRPSVSDLNIEIADGEFLVLVGPSGCGKSTSLRMLAGLEDVNAGRILIGDRDVTDVQPKDRDIAMVFQNYALFPNMNVAQNVEYGLKVQGVGRGEREARVKEMLALVDLSALANRAIDKLSGGQKQRVALARALAARPKVLLFDEPLAALDAKLRERLRIEIGALLKKLAITAVYVAHDQQEAMALGDRIAVMEQGRIAQIDTPQAIYQRPATRFVADFVGAINCVETDARGEPRQFCRPEDILLADDSRYARHGYIVGNTFLGAVQRLQIDIGLAAPIQVERHAREAWHAGQRVTWTLAPRAALDFTGY